MKNLSFQLYSARKFQPLEDILAMLAKIGYTQIETFGAQYENPSSMADLAKKFGLKIPSGHFGLPMLESDAETVVSIANQLEMQLVICPYLDAADRPTDAAGWSDFGAKLEGISKSLKSRGLNFAWHNHDFEFVPLADGSIPMDLILKAAPSMSWEADLAWTVRAGFDPIVAINRHKDRISSVHIKDIAPQGEAEDEDGWADVGFGTIDWPNLLKLIGTNNGIYFVVEHDNPNDAERFARRSFQSLQQWI